MGYIPVLYTVMVSVFVSYVAFIWSKYGVLPSISESYYRLPKKLQPLFTFFCWGFSIPAMILGSTGLMFFAGAGISFVGAAAAFKDTMTKEVHTIGAVTGVLMSQLATILNFGLWPISVVFFSLASLLFLFRKKINNKHIWWVELLSFLSVCITLGIILF